MGPHTVPRSVAAAVAALLAIAGAPLPFVAGPDSRNASYPYGTILSPPGGRGYSDQPQIVIVNSSYWLCVLTCSPEREGQQSQIAATLVSRDDGRSWSPPVSIEPEPAQGQRVAASWVNPLLLSDGRLFVFYTFNIGNITRWPNTNHSIGNSNLLGGQFYRVSTDAGRTFSQRRSVPIRPTTIDLENPFRGQVPMGWSVGKPFVATDGTAYFQYTKIGCPPSQAYNCDMVVSYDEAWLFASKDLTKASAGQAPTFVTLPSGNVGLTAHNRTDNETSSPITHSALKLKPQPPPNPTGQNSWIAEEGDVVEMGSFSPAHLYYMYRTSDGYLGVGTS